MFKQYENIFIFLDHRQVGAFLRKNKIEYYLLEDGYNFYSFPPRKQIIYSNPYKNFIYNLVFPTKGGYGNSKYCKSIEVNDLNVILPVYSSKKFTQLSRKELFSNIDESKKETIFNIFGVEKPSSRLELSETSEISTQTPTTFQKGKPLKNLLVLTQPLFQDNFAPNIINSREDQFLFYKKIVDDHKDEYKIFIKIHPRDETDYSSIKNVEFLNKDIPIELYDLAGGGTCFFDKGITHSSTALDFLSSVKLKEYVCSKN